MITKAELKDQLEAIVRADQAVRSLEYRIDQALEHYAKPGIPPMRIKLTEIFPEHIIAEAGTQNLLTAIVHRYSRPSDDWKVALDDDTLIFS